MICAETGGASSLSSRLKLPSGPFLGERVGEGVRIDGEGHRYGCAWHGDYPVVTDIESGNARVDTVYNALGIVTALADASAAVKSASGSDSCSVECSISNALDSEGPVPRYTVTYDGDMKLPSYERNGKGRMQSSSKEAVASNPESCCFKIADTSAGFTSAIFLCLNTSLKSKTLKLLI